ncbi:MAG: DUF72 domain-containing protein [Chloroflexota bacterium]
MKRIFLGTQGWSYKDWVGSFYPPATRAADYLAVYARSFDAVELDTTFYATPPESRVDLWSRATPPHFQFTAKVPRSITHDRHLIDTKDDFLEFLHAITGLGDKLGAILIQMPPDFTIDERPALEDFLSHLPSDLRFALELRHRSWLQDGTYDLLAEHGVAWTMIDLSFMPKHVEVTTDFSYVRWLGDRHKIQRVHATQIERSAELDRWIEVLETVASKVERLYGFVNNHYSGHSPADVRYLRERLIGTNDDVRDPQPTQGSLI